tara:strand:- start:992 stop:1450 length:459 start_codon:yes stop_codon:yes gene_type:complete
MDYFAKGIGSNKQKGTAGELLFIYEAYRRGLFPCKPEGDPPCFDNLVINRRTGKPIIVQTRTSELKGDPKRGSRYQTKALCNNDTLHISETNVNILAVYCVPLNWYFIPVKKIDVDSVGLYPHIKNSRGRWEKFKDKWGVFGFSKGDPVLLS